MKSKIAGALVVAVVYLGCAGDRPASEEASSIAAIMATPDFEKACAGVPGCAEQLQPVPGPKETIWRVQVVREVSGNIRFGTIDAVEVVEGAGVPLGPRTGEYLLVGLDGSGSAVDGQLVQFPTAARIEFEDRTKRQEFVDLTGSEVSSIGYVRALPSIEQLVLQDSSRNVVVRVSLPSTQASLHQWEVPAGLGLVSAAWATGGPTGTAANCPHVRILGGETDRDLLGTTPLGLTIELEAPGTVALANIIAALGRMTPLLCQSVSRIAFGRFWQEGVAGQVLQMGWGDMMMVNLEAGYSEFQLQAPGTAGTFRQMDLQHTIIHEAGHTAEALLNAEGETLVAMGFEGAWSEGARSVARDTIDRVRLAKGFGVEWRRMHDSFVSQGWAKEHTWSADAIAGVTGWVDEQVDGAVDVPQPDVSHRQWTDAQVAEAGFISRYAATNWADDIADSVAWVYMGEEYARAGVGRSRRDDGCIQMQLQGDKELPARLAAVYTKLQFLKDLGLVTPEGVKSCTGVNIGLPITNEGFEIWQGGSLKRSFTVGVEAGIGTKRLTRHKVFKMEASGTAGFGEATYPATITLHLDLEAALDPITETPWPRGVYKFDPSLFSGNQLMVRLDGAPAGNIDADLGFAIVTEASNQRIVGSVFLTQALRPSTPSPLPVYQTFDPPLIIRFLMEK